VLKRHVLLAICSDTPPFISGAREPSEPWNYSLTISVQMMQIIEAR
jgi:hypothetical protein